MTARGDVFSVGSWYHCYNRSIDKRLAFADLKDYQRFLEILYLANDERPVRRNDLGVRSFEDVLVIPRDQKIVSVRAFSILPDHFHLVLQEVAEGGITSFMRKLGTAYTLYFNSRYSRMGNLFLKPFRSLQVSDAALEQLTSFVHCTPALLFEPKWKSGHIVDAQFLEERIAAYPYSSIRTHIGTPSATRAILDTPKDSVFTVHDILQKALTYRTGADIL